MNCAIQYSSYASIHKCERKQGTPVESHEWIFKSNALRRVYTEHTKDAECFYLRMLLHEISGTTCSTNFTTVDGYFCVMYREAC